MSGESRSHPREKFEPLVTRPIELDALGTELTICFKDIGGPCEIKTCYGDICKIVNALRDYSKMLRMVCEEWNLQGFERITFENHADKLEEISKKYQAGIGYDYDQAVEKCQKKRAKKQRDEDVGGEAMEMAYLKAQRMAAKQAQDNSAPSQTGEPSGKGQSDVPLKVEQVGYYDILDDDGVIFWVDVSGVPPKMQAEARLLDGSSYDPNCFGVCVNYNFKQCQFSLVTDTEASEGYPSNLYYMDSSGDKHWFTAELTQTFMEQAFLACVQAAAQESMKISPTKQQAKESAALEAAEYCRFTEEEESEAEI